MASIKKIARRSFLIGSAAIVGGVAFGAYKYTRPLVNPIEAGPNEAALNPFVFIDQDGVTIITPRAEMGQGVHTTLAALVAEELDIAWEDVRVLHGPPAAAYYNSALMKAGLPVPDYSKGAFMEALSSALGEANKLLGIQLTGGSTSMMDGYERLRQAGASARETLKLAAADALQVSASSLRTVNGRIIAPDGNSVSYSDMASLAAEIDPPQVDLRPKSEWKYLGKAMPRVDMVGKSTGTAEFGVDVRLEGLKFATVRMNPRLGASMHSIDTSAAENMAGVEKIIKLDGGFAVVASNTWLAFQAADAVEVNWERASYPAAQKNIWWEIEQSFESKANSVLRDDGKPDRAIEGATEIEAEYRMPFLAHATMEPMNATALYSGDTLEVWCGHQGPTVARDACAAAVGLEPEQVTINTTYLGGGFGRRIESDYAVYAAQIAKEMPGVPVQVTWSREEDMSHDYYRPAAIGRYKGAVKDGKAVLLDAKVAGPSVAFDALTRMMGVGGGGPDKVHVEGAFDQPYQIPNYRVAGHLTDLSVPLGFWRSVGNSVNAFMHDSFLDELAHAAGADPLAFRLELMGDEHAPSRGVLEAVRDMSGWTGKKEAGIGRGVAFAHSFGTPVAQVIEVLDEDGSIRINRAWIAADLGTALDPGNLEAQLYGGMIYGLSAACFGEITFEDGSVEQQNFPDYDALRIHNAPITEVKVLESGHHLGGAGEPGTPPSMSALSNAIFDLTGTRARTLPLMHDFDLIT
ncbi:molybdopterin cofactor-binding domain-containing protein [Planktotalea sp.]|uniref:xanthine dehydrogenase family protein molybdopterin-binding subunit n=1 Tax=Planktotalea sp. TaxID=2029877 RepID=UPI00329873E1